MVQLHTVNYCDRSHQCRVAFCRYESPHLTDYTYSHNKSNYSNPVQVSGTNLGIVVPAGAQASLTTLVTSRPSYQ